MKKTLSITQERKRIQKTFMIPMVVTLLVMIIAPLVSLLVFSLTSVEMGFKNFRFIGVTNYSILFNDPDFWTAFANTLLMMAGIIFVQMLLGYSLAIVIFKSKFLTKTVRLVMMFPMVISPIIVGIIWRILLMPKYGGINMILSMIGIENIPNWFGGVWLSKLVIIVAASWEWTPFVILYILAGLEGLPASPFESAKIDGANAFHEIVYLIIPMLKKLTVTVMIFRVIESFKIFPLIYSITSGGPGNATEDLTYMVYKNGFKYLKLGYASTVSMIILVLILLAIIAMGITNSTQKTRGKD